MELATIDMPKTVAQENLDAYVESLRTDRNSEDERIAAGYRVLARGMPLLNLPQTIWAGGFFPNGLPRMAVARADAKICYVTRNGLHNDRWQLTFADDDPFRENRGALVGMHTVLVTGDAPPGTFATDRRYWEHASTIVPIVPPGFRPKTRNRLRKLHVLWEVDEWKQIPPHDPALIKHVGGDLWAVLAVWDLTELERAIIAGRGSG